MVVALLSELVVVRERLDTVERLSAAGGLFSREAIESYEPDTAAKHERSVLRARQIDKVLQPLRIDAEAAVGGTRDDDANAVLSEEMIS